jgi:uncharacterized membrane protein
MVTWLAPSAEPASPITGYILEMNEGFLGSEFTRIYDGSSDNNNLMYLKQGLTNGLLYTFRVFAINFNGISDSSLEATFYACVAPSGFNKPLVVS